jgi:NAD(P)-dependent dehydrogenase (short-subunit alcohol dehydrogenase family)
MLVGAVEEISDEQARAQMDVNFFGALAASRAVLPGMRARRRGHIMQVSSIGGRVAYPALGIYQASKWALEAMSQALAAEVAAFGIQRRCAPSSALTDCRPCAPSTPAAGHSSRNGTTSPASPKAHQRTGQTTERLCRSTSESRGKKAWGGWGSNPRPADYESTWPVHAIISLYLHKFKTIDESGGVRRYVFGTDTLG